MGKYFKGIMTIHAFFDEAKIEVGGKEKKGDLSVEQLQISSDAQ